VYCSSLFDPWIPAVLARLLLCYRNCTALSTDAGRIQNLGDGVWPLVSALLPRTAAIKVYPARVGVKAFGSESEYGAYLNKFLQPGFRLVAIAGAHNGDSGTFISSYSSSYDPNCNVRWDASGNQGRVHWREVEIEVPIRRTRAVCEVYCPVTSVNTLNPCCIESLHYNGFVEDFRIFNPVLQFNREKASISFISSFAVARTNTKYICIDLLKIF
jgi:hypothetical protein